MSVAPAVPGEIEKMMTVIAEVSGVEHTSGSPHSPVTCRFALVIDNADLTESEATLCKGCAPIQLSLAASIKV